jgi:vacuolar protein sorting-associated protein 41
VQLRSFARPVQAVALSPDYKNDRTYLSGGKAGNLVLGVGGPLGRSTSTTTGSAAAITSGWLGTVGLGSGAAKETVLHHGEGTISTIKWSLSGKYVVWLNEVGFKIMRSGLHFDAEGAHHADEAWRRIGGFERPQNKEWDVMAGVWRGRAEWIDEKAVLPDGEEDAAGKEALMSPVRGGDKSKAPQIRGKDPFERLIVGWGSRIWIVHVHPGGIGVGRHAGERLPGRAEIVNM